MSLRTIRLLACLTAVTLGLGSASAGEVIVDFDNLSLGTDSAVNGPMANATEVIGKWGPIDQGTFASGGVDFINRSTSGYWEGFAYSNKTDVTAAGLDGQFDVYAGAAHSGENFGVAYGYHDLTTNNSGNEPFDPTNVAHLEGLPYFTLPTGAAIQGMYVANTTYTALSLLLGDPFTGRPMGGLDGTIPDWFKVTAYGTDAGGDVLTDASGNALFVDLFLGDNRLGQRFIADSWLYMDLSSLVGAERLYFNTSSTLTGPWGMDAPGYFAVDDVRYTTGVAAVPEPASLAMAASAVLIVGLVSRRRTRA